jgi:hypothetical protein
MRASFRSRVAPWGLFALLTTPLFTACGSPAAPPKAPTAAAGPAPVARPVARPPLASEELATMKRLEVHLAHLGKIGERHPGKAWELADAADYLATQLEGLGYRIERQGYESGDVAAHNLIATAPGGAGGEQVIVVGAHYDSALGDAGRHVGGSGALALLELARAFSTAELSRTLRFAFFALGESPHGDGSFRGARVYGEALAKRAAAAQAELARDAEGKASGALPAALPEPAVDRSRVVAVVLLDRLLRFEHSEGEVVVTLAASAMADAYQNALADSLATPPLRVQRNRLEPTPADSDASYFSSQGIPVVLVQGRSSAGGTEDIDALTRVVFGVKAALQEAAGAQASGGDPYMQ